MSPEPVYTSDNVKSRYQLIYSLTVFWKTSPGTQSWLAELKALTESDGIRILQHRFSNLATSQFLISTLPTVSPQLIPARVKGRLQHLLKNDFRQPFQRNYDLISIGSTKGEKVQDYVAGQIQHHSDDEQHLPAELADLQFQDPDADLLKPRFTNHGRCTCNLHIVVVRRDRHEVHDRGILTRVRSMIRSWAEKHGLLLSRIAILPDHLHVTIGIAATSVPLDLALSLMNNLAWLHDMQPVLEPTCFLGTFGQYDLGAIRDET